MLFGRTKRGKENDIKLDFKEMCLEFFEYINLAQYSDDLAGCCGHDNEPSISLKCGEFLDWLTIYLSS
jgi:hypothetical protein